jgi:hypothetical protein
MKDFPNKPVERIDVAFNGVMVDGTHRTSICLDFGDFTYLLIDLDEYKDGRVQNHASYLNQRHLHGLEP